MEFKHISVLLDETIEELHIKPDGIYVDGTLGGGGHAYHVCQKLSEKGRYIGIDQDADAIAASTKRLEPFKDKVTIVRDNYVNMPKVLYDLGIEIEENSELDLFEAFNQHEGDERIPAIIKEMEEELGAGNKKPEILSKLAQYELTLKDWIRDHKGYRKYVTIAGKCWPAFQTQFGFVPCYVNSRLAAQGIPVSCEVDIYGALSEFIGTVVSQDAVTLLDINNSVPADMYNEEIKDNYDYTQKDTFMGFHCGNTAKSKLSFCEMKYQKIMARTLPEEVTQGTLEGDLVPGDITFFRLQSTADTKLRAYVAQGEILPVATRSFGSIGVFAIPEMGRFYRHVLIEKNFPHHGAVAFGHFGKTLYEVFKYIGVDVDEIGFNQPKNMLYKTENPFS